MTYPLISEYIDAILSPEDSFDELKYLQPVLDISGKPIMSSGNFAVVFKMIDGDGKYYALKCFLRDQEKRADKYRLISERLKDVCSPYFVEVKYYEKELFVDSKQTDETEFPVLLMDWVEGMTLNNYIRHIKQDENSEIKLKFLAFCFSRMSSWLLRQDFAHGDIKPDNILVKEDGGLVLIDYDGMFVPQMEYAGYRQGDEIGSPGFRHPQRKVAFFSSKMDDFSLIVILLSLLIVANDSDFWHDDSSANKLVFTESDFENPFESTIIRQMISSSNDDIKRLTGLLLFALTTSPFEGIDPSLLQLDLEVGDPFEYMYKWGSDRNIVYSQDKKCLLSGTSLNDSTVIVPPGTLYIQRYAFVNNTTVKRVILPEGLLYIGKGAFSGCSNLERINLPKSLLFIRSNPFENCCSLDIIESKHYDQSNHCLILHGELVSVIAKETIDEMVIPKEVSKIGDGAFDSCKHIHRLIFNKTIPQLPSSLGNRVHRAFHETSCLDGHGIIKQNTMIGFVSDEPMDYYDIPACITYIESFVFKSQDIKSIRLPPAVTSIGVGVFEGCKSLESVKFPDTLIKIGAFCFSSCNSLTELSLPDSLERIGEYSFEGCKSLKKVRIPNRIKTINSSSFCDCYSLETIEFPDTLEYICELSFSRCKSIKSVSFNKNLIEIQGFAFSNCHRLCSIMFSSTYVRIQSTAFRGCDSLSTVVIPRGSLEYYRSCEAFSSLHQNDITFIEY